MTKYYLNPSKIYLCRTINEHHAGINLEIIKYIGSREQSEGNKRVGNIDLWTPENAMRLYLISEEEAMLLLL